MYLFKEGVPRGVCGVSLWTAGLFGGVQVMVGCGSWSLCLGPCKIFATGLSWDACTLGDPAVDSMEFAAAESGPDGGGAGPMESGPMEIAAVELGVSAGSGQPFSGLEAQCGLPPSSRPYGVAHGVEQGAGELFDASCPLTRVDAVLEACTTVRRTSSRLAGCVSSGILVKAIARKAGLRDVGEAAASGVRVSSLCLRRTVEKGRRCGVHLDDAQASEFEAFVRNRV